MKRLIALLAALPLTLLLGTAPSNAHAPTAIGAVPVVTGLSWPAGFTFAPDGRIFYGERFTGEIRIYDPSNSSNTLFFTIPNLSTQGEQGLLGIALDPNFQTTRPYVYVYATRVTPNGLRNQIIRIKYVGGTGSTPKLIFTSDTVAGQYHDGGRIKFGPDGYLYAVVGEGHDSSNAQNLSNYAGKILRMNGAGHVPPDNPFPGSLIWSFGHRNSFGFSFDPQTGNLWQTENGPECNDEINMIKKGGNFAWGPAETCSGQAPQNTNQDGPQPRIMPLSWFTPTIAPVGTAFCASCGLGAQSEGTMFFGQNNPGFNVRQVVLTPDRMGIQSITTVYNHSQGVVSMEVGIDHALYFSDSQAIYKLVQV
jgi:glucose/arabinose dehydrogenase